MTKPLEETENTKFKMTARTMASLAVLIGAAILLAVVLRAGPAEQQTGVSLLVLAPAAFLAGTLSLLSPCSLPILPAYFAFSFQTRQQSVVRMTVAFFLGLAFTMVVLGTSATALGSFLLRHLPALTLLGGLAIIGFGVLSFLGKGFSGVQFQERPAATAVGSFVYGATFALGWTACVGPILGAVLTLLATQGMGMFQGAFLAFIYALGLGLPLILLASWFSRLGSGSRFWKVIRGRGFEVKLGKFPLTLHTNEMLSGLLLIGIGSLLASGRLTEITQLATQSSLSQWVVSLDEQLRILFGIR